MGGVGVALKAFLNKVIGLSGYKVVSARGSRNMRDPLVKVFATRFTSRYLVQICAPATVIDVGTGFGTEPLLAAFPDATFYLFEPLLKYRVAIRSLQERVECRVFYKAAGNKPGEAELIVDSQHPTKSSLYERTELTADNNTPLIKERVEVVTLDEVFEQVEHVPEPVLLKIDTEGHELSVLEGAERTLGRVDTIIAEISIAKRFKKSYHFEDVVAFLRQRGFCFFSVLTVDQRKNELRPRYLDAVFKRCNGNRDTI